MSGERLPTSRSKTVPELTDTLPELMRGVRERTPARILVGRAGPSYRTATQLELRQDHAAAIDAVHAELELARDLGDEFNRRWKLFEVSTCASNKSEFLLRPDLGRKLHEKSRQIVRENCQPGIDLQVIIGDGLSVLAVGKQVPSIIPLLAEGAKQRGWSFGRPFVIHHCRVGILNEIGELLQPRVIVLLIGERPGVATAESLSAYMAYQPRSGYSDADRNLISNIHARGICTDAAAARILALAEKMRQMQASGVTVKEELVTGKPAFISLRADTHT